MQGCKAGPVKTESCCWFWVRMTLEASGVGLTQALQEGGAHGETAV